MGRRRCLCGRKHQPDRVVPRQRLSRQTKALAESRWSHDPFARGCYSHALPGHAGDGAVLAAPVDGRLFFAGDATSPGFFSTAHGARIRERGQRGGSSSSQYLGLVARLKGSSYATRKVVAVRLAEGLMKTAEDNWAWKEVSFAKWRRAVNRRLKDIYVITIDDAGIDDDRLLSHWQMKQSPYEFVEWFGNKYDLDPKSAFGL
jgi:hypothetical protein